ncbi:hypothetical protein [Pseudonocardia sp.]|jgi:hypothetical protein|uniref:hypothetical protein n=1 Tax=Pseudonocardia sp. TaxID=60912 RepID=UPI0031FD40DC
MTSREPSRPYRIQLSRKSGARLPADAVSIGPGADTSAGIARALRDLESELTKPKR